MNIPFLENSKEKAFKKLYEAYYAPLCLFAKRYIDDKYICQDIVSDVFASIWDKLNTFELKSETALAFLKTCIRNSCLNYLKHLEYEWSYAEIYQKQEPVYASQPDAVYTLDELYSMLHETLNKLPEQYRTVFIKSLFDEKTHAEIAEEMNISVKTVNRYKQRTRDLLRNKLKDYIAGVLFLLLT